MKKRTETRIEEEFGRLGDHTLDMTEMDAIPMSKAKFEPVWNQERLN